MDSDEKKLRLLDLLIKEWSVVIQTQMHFNEMIMRMRTNALTVTLAVFGAAAVSLRYEKLGINMYGYSFHVAVPIILFGLVLLLGVGILDFFYYHQMLKGAVKRSAKIDDAFEEKEYQGIKFFGMTNMITNQVNTRFRVKLGKRTLLKGKRINSWSSVLVGFYYGSPFVLGIAYLYLVLKFFKVK